MLKKYIPLILQKKNKTFCLNLHYNKENSYLYVNGTEITKFKSKDPEILPYPLCLENISRDWSVDDLKKNGIKQICLRF